MIQGTITHRGTFLGVNWYMSITPMRTKNAYVDASPFETFSRAVGDLTTRFIDTLIPCIHGGCTYYEPHLPSGIGNGSFIGWDYAHTEDIFGGFDESILWWKLGQTIDTSVLAFATKVSDEDIQKDIQEVIRYMTESLCRVNTFDEQT